MSLINFSCSVDSFHVDRTGHSAFGDGIRLEGWLIAHPEPARVELVIGSRDPAQFEIRDRRRFSDDVHHHFGYIYGEAARNCRMVLAEKFPLTPVDWDRVVLRITGGDGSVVEIKLDPPTGLHQPQVASAADRDLVMRFESCGDNCEYGLLQRKIGIERMALLRYSGVANISALADLIENRFDGFAEGEALIVHPFGAEWVAALPFQQMNFHTGRLIGDISEHEIRIQERRKLQFLAQKFLDDIELGSKIFVYRTMRDERGGADGMKGMDRLHEVIRRLGPARLLWVNEADTAHEPGTVYRVREGLYHGYVERLAPHADAFAADVAGWLTLLRAAARLIDGDAASAHSDDARATA